MNIERIKEKIESLVGKNVIIKINNGRNKYEYLEGKITKVYPYIFSVDIGSTIKSFSYSDVLIKNVIIKLV